MTASAASALGSRPLRRAAAAVQHAAPCATPPRQACPLAAAPSPLPPSRRLRRPAVVAALPARGARPGPRRPPREREEFEEGEGRDEMQLWKDRLAGMRPTERSVAVQQLLRIEEEGAFAGLVSGLAGALLERRRWSRLG